jgi:hypothetical protein
LASITIIAPLLPGGLARSGFGRLLRRRFAGGGF